MEAEIVQGLAMAVFRLWGFVSAHELRPSIRLHLSPPVFLLLCLVASGGGRERDMLHQVGYFKTGMFQCSAPNPLSIRNSLD